VRINHNNIFVGNNRGVKFFGGNGLSFKGNWIESGGVAGTYALEITPGDVSRLEYGHNWYAGAPVSGGIINDAGTQDYTPGGEEAVFHGDLIFGKADWLNQYKLVSGGISPMPTAAYTAPSDLTIEAAAAVATQAAHGGNLTLALGNGSQGQQDGVLVIKQGADAQNLRVATLTELTTILAAATTNTAMQIPSHAVVFGVSVRTTVTIPTATSYTVTGATSGTAFNTAAVGAAAGSVDSGTQNCPYKNGALQNIRITPDAVPANANGQVRVTIHYYQITAPAS